MTIGIIGSGNVGGTLGTRWAKAGHEIIFGTRDAQASDIKQLLAQAGGKARAASLQETVRSADVLLVALHWGAAQSVLQGLGDLSGKVLIDAMNPLLPDLSGLDTGTTSSAAEKVAAWARGAKVVKAFNTIGFNIMANTAFGSERPALFYCGDDAAAKQITKQLAGDLGFEPLDAGPLTQARLLEPYALLWISLALKHGFGRDIAFKLLRR
jgi:8-hydroxy-5-deazaflavin:NADPH oxidoreductase